MHRRGHDRHPGQSHRRCRHHHGVYDANARVKGALLDVSGATGAMTVGADANSDLRVYAASAATEETLVCHRLGTHIDTVAVT